MTPDLIARLRAKEWPYKLPHPWATEIFMDFDAIKDLQKEAATALETLTVRIAELEAALDRLGSMEAFLQSRVVDPEADAELIERIKFAERALKRLATPPTPEIGDGP